MAGAGKFITVFFHTFPVSCGASDLVFFIDLVETPKSEVIVPLNTSGVSSARPRARRATAATHA